MTSPIDAWNQLCLLENVRLPADIDELDVVCSESATRAVSHVGIELENCVFNNSTLQQLRRRVAPGAKTTVEVRYNSTRMTRIWVEDPVTHERFEVLNQDPATKDLSAYQVSMLYSVIRKAQSTGTIMTRAQARKKIEEMYRPLLLANTMRERRRALKILGLIAEEKPLQKLGKGSSKKSASRKAAVPQSTASQGKTVDANDPPKASPIGMEISQATAPPKFKVTRSANRASVSTFSPNGDANAR